MKIYRVFTCTILLSLGCADAQRNEQKPDADIQSIVGKTVIEISGKEKPICITMDDGTQVVFDCYKYSMKVEISKPTARTLDK